MPRPVVPQVEEDLEDIDPEKTLVREDWETAVIRRVAPHVAAVGDVDENEERYGWESEGLRRLSREVERVGNESPNA